ncbi:RHS Repeat protein [Mariniflexile rhizosphaerae]|uniref:DUF6443 domain-containing protein n=1 Tax=unclassified Mariniflexile TaxID=2643887 RepID=UPI000CADEDE8|nr:DUF6443 domain-containing protein [Mariniflexile sp. TRM1-10]AXP80303.1 RHS Repeat protein [Mariniflexile sp. TRM1-10]PLB20677.1 MAG: Cell well associated RhsD protein [Flavobacteriaceae bacterium FS1-H7996/R]
MKKILITLIALLVSSSIVAQTNSENYIHTKNYQVKTQDGLNTLSNTSLTNDDIIETITYYDGLNRPIQAIARQAGGSRQDIITPILYDDFGRQVKTYLPYANPIQTVGTSLDYRDPTALVNNLNLYYLSKFPDDLDIGFPNPYSEKAYESSPLNRVLKQAAPGKNWSLGEGHEIKFNYLSNDSPTPQFLLNDDFTINTNNWYAVGPSNNFSIENGMLKATPQYPGEGVKHDIAVIEGETLYISFDFNQGSTERVMLNIVGTTTLEDYLTDGTYNIKITVPSNTTQLGLYFLKHNVANNSTFNITNFFIDNIKVYRLNPVPNSEVKVFSVSHPDNDTAQIELAFNDYYNSNELYKTVTKDENWTVGTNHTTEEFKDKQGRVILTRTYADVSGVSTPHDTYYVYDEFGNLTYVLPPKAEAGTATLATINSKLNDLCYQYKYDYRNRLIEKRIPGKGWEYIVYDKLDRPVLTQDANLRANNKWLFTKYDAFGRIVYTGIYQYSSLKSQSEMQGILDAYYTNTSANLYESKQNSEGSYHYYGNQSFPNSNIEVLTVNYYDNYSFNIPTSITIPSEVWETGDIATYTKSLATASKVKVLDTNEWITTITVFNKKAQPIWIGSYNSYLKTTDIVKSKPDFIGKILSTVSIHRKIDAEDIVVEDTFEYDHMGRLLAQTQGLRDSEFDATIDLILDDTTPNNQTSYIASTSITLKPNFTALPGFSAKINSDTQERELIVLNKYDELGQLENKKVGGVAAGTIENSAGLQTIDYTYNIRGWLKQINNPTALGNDLFAFKINYNTNTHGGTNLFNGNISETEWKTQNDNVLRWYKYGYDALNRITSGTNPSNNNYDLANVAYDKNGNITNLVRRGHTNSGATTFGTMDDLTYSYLANSNKLMRVADAAPIDQYGFKDDALNTAPDSVDDYSYDANGNMTKDLNKRITHIEYNHLNLPTKIYIKQTDNEISLADNIEYIYDANGMKLQKKKKVQGVSHDYLTQYAGNFVYSGTSYSGISLKFFNHPEGYVEPNEQEYFNYAYQYKDHLGNIRLSYKDMSTTSTPVLEILEENNYYPFGLKHKGYNGTINGVDHPYGFGGKEEQNEFNNTLQWLDFGARNYDAALGRWMNIDPLADIAHSISITPYHYGANNPIVFVDPDGQDWFYYMAEGEEEASYHWHKGSEYNHSYSYTDENGDEQTSNITLTGVSSFVGKDQNGAIYNFKNDGSIVQSEATESMLKAGGLDTSFLVDVVSSVGENGNEVQLAGADAVALAATAFMTADGVVLDGTDAAWPKWATYAMVGAGATYLLNQSKATLNFSKTARGNHSDDGLRDWSDDEIAQEVSKLSGQLNKQQKALKLRLQKEQKVRGQRNKQKKGSEKGTGTGRK